MDFCYILGCPGGPQVTHLPYRQLPNLVGSHILLQLEAFML